MGGSLLWPAQELIRAEKRSMQAAGLEQEEKLDASRYMVVSRRQSRSYKITAITDVRSDMKRT